MAEAGTMAQGQRQRNRRGEGALLRAELIEAAARLLEACGDAEILTLRAVAREAGIAAPSIYRHFPDKSDLVRAVVADRFGRLDDALRDAMTGAGDPAGALRAFCAAYCAFGLGQPGHYRILFAARLHAVPPVLPEDMPGRRVFQRLQAAIQACADAGLARPGDAFAMAVNVWVALHGIVSLRASRPAFPWPGVPALTDAVLAGQVWPASTANA